MSTAEVLVDSRELKEREERLPGTVKIRQSILYVLGEDGDAVVFSQPEGLSQFEFDMLMAVFLEKHELSEREAEVAVGLVTERARFDGELHQLVKQHPEFRGARVDELMRAFHLTAVEALRQDPTLFVAVGDEGLEFLLADGYDELKPEWREETRPVRLDDTPLPGPSRTAVLTVVTTETSRPVAAPKAVRQERSERVVPLRPIPPSPAKLDMSAIAAALLAKPYKDPGIKEGNWAERALCAQTDPEAFFPEKGGSTREAKKICAACPVRTECLAEALKGDERFGIWGGMSERERRRLKRLSDK